MWGYGYFLRSLNVNTDILEFKKSFLIYFTTFINFALYLSDKFLDRTWKSLLHTSIGLFFLTAFGRIMKQNRCSIASNMPALFSLKEWTWDLPYNQCFKQKLQSIPNCLSYISNLAVNIFKWRWAQGLVVMATWCENIPCHSSLLDKNILSFQRFLLLL